MTRREIGGTATLTLCSVRVELLIRENPLSKRLTAIIQREGDGFVALCPELDVASQGDTIEAARENLREALELFFECASPGEIQQRFGGEVFVTHVEVAVG